MFINRLYKSNRCKYPGCDAILGGGLYYYGNHVAVCSRCFHSMYQHENIENIENPNQILQIPNNIPFLETPSSPQSQINPTAPLPIVSPVSWLVYQEGTRGPDNGIRGVNFDWDAVGLWFSGDAGANTPAYPIYTAFTIPETARTEISVDFIYDDYESKNFGLCVYVDGVIPEWKWDYINSTRIAGQYDSSKSGPSLSGIRFTCETEMEMEFDTVYTCKFIYDPVNKPNVVMETWIKCRLDENNVPIPESVSGIAPYLADSKYMNEVLPSGNYRVGFTADNDILPPNRTYLQNMRICVYKDGLNAADVYEDSLSRQ